MTWDQAIAHVAAVCRDGKRTPDIVARIGGEEFALLLPETSIESARPVAERLRRQIADTPLIIAGAPIAITVSIGVAEATPEMADIAALMRAADQALYDAKHAGRNRVVAVTEPPAGPIALAS
jgi:diguanylate cyclase (GGDEF)-like protein